VIAFVFVAKKLLFDDIDVQRRKAAKIFACFLSGRKRAENVNRAKALVVALLLKKYKKKFYFCSF
jgi:hypothetical protein